MLPVEGQSEEQKLKLLAPFIIENWQLETIKLSHKGNAGTVHTGSFIPNNSSDFSKMSVNIKQLSSKLPNDSREEALILSQLNGHPNIVKMIGFEPQHNYLVTAFYSDGCVSDFFTKLSKDRTAKPVDIGHSLEIIRQVANGIAHIHANRIVHRDIAARNCLLKYFRKTGKLLVKIGDFGHATSVSAELESAKPTDEIELWQRRAFKGYMWRWYALETLEHKSFSTKSDIWTFAIFIQEVMTGGGVPYGMLSEDEGSAAAFIPWLREGNRADHKQSSTPQSLRDLQLDCWNADPLKRPTIEQILSTLTKIDNTETLQWHQLFEEEEDSYYEHTSFSSSTEDQKKPSSTSTNLS